MEHERVQTNERKSICFAHDSFLQKGCVSPCYCIVDMVIIFLISLQNDNAVIDECYKLKVRGMQAGRISAQGGGGVPSSLTLDPDSQEFSRLKERVLLMEVSHTWHDLCALWYLQFVVYSIL